ncbi:MAG: hemerythrin family protein [Syntrophomonadaceae bacterium]
MIQWKESYRLGIEEIDNQHKKLFEIANRVYELLKNEMLVDKYDHIVSIIEELRDYAKYHFQYEEDYMEKINYRKRLSHKVIHNDFVEKMNEINLDQVDENQDQYLMNILDFVVQWIEQHILGTDKLYATENQ